MTAIAIAAMRSVDAEPKPPEPTSQTMNAITTMIAPYITIFSLPLSLFQNAEIVGGMNSSLAVIVRTQHLQARA